MVKPGNDHIASVAHVSMAEIDSKGPWPLFQTFPRSVADSVPTHSLRKTARRHMVNAASAVIEKAR